MAGFLLILSGIILAATRPTSAINCLVCHSINGSNPECETPHMTSNPALIQTNCRSTIGLQNSKLPLMAMACITSLAEFRKESGSPVYVISRYCTAVIPHEYQAKNIVCGQIQAHGIPPEQATFPLFGCSALCTDNACNSATIVKLAFRMKEKYGYYVEDERQRDPRSSPHFPNILKVADKLMLQYEESRTRKTLTQKGHANTTTKPSNDSVVVGDVTEGYFSTTDIPSNDTVPSAVDALTRHSDTTMLTISVDAAPSNVTVAGSDLVSNETKSVLTDVLVNIPTILLAQENNTVVGNVDSPAA